MVGSLTNLLLFAVVFALLNRAEARNHKVLKCPCTFSVSREVLPSANHEKFDVLVQPITSVPNKDGPRQSNIIEKHSFRDLKVTDAVATSSGYHVFQKMQINEKGLFRVRVRHQSNNQESNPDYDLNLHAISRQIICPVVLVPDPPRLQPLSRELNSGPFVRQTVGVNDSEIPRIVGGLFISPTLLPYLVGILIPQLCEDGTEGCGSLCSGTILSSRWVMTAAHCQVTVGSRIYVTTTRILTGPFTTVTRVFNNPGYNDPPSLLDYFNDIAVVELAVDIEGCCNPSPLFMPINFNQRLPRPDTFVRPAGYGVDAEDPENRDPVSGRLRQVDVPVVRTSRCRDAYGTISDTQQVCAGYLIDGQCDSCFGDSGGPLVQYAGNTPVLVGVTSFGQGCARPGFPGVYTNPAGHREWLESTPAIFTAHRGGINQVRRRCAKGSHLPYVEGQVSNCIPCADNEISAGGPVRICRPCPGTLLRDTGNGNRCSCRAVAGAGRIRGETMCTQCRPGFFSNVGRARCVKCRPGSFAPQAGLEACLPCPGAPRGARECPT